MIATAMLSLFAGLGFETPIEIFQIASRIRGGVLRPRSSHASSSSFEGEVDAAYLIGQQWNAYMYSQRPYNSNAHVRL